jgi:hypothetical protein
MSAKLRFMIMVGADALCVMAALAAMVAHATYHLAVGLPLFAAAMLIGFGVQIWFIVSLAMASRLEKGL